MKIAILTPLYWPTHGGVQTMTRLLAEYLARQGHTVRVMTSRLKSLADADVRNFRPAENFPETETRNGVHIRRFTSGGPVDFALGALFRIAYHTCRPLSDRFFELYWLRRLRARQLISELCADPPDVILAVPCTDWLLRIALEAARRTGAKVAMKSCLHLSARVSGQRRLDLLKKFDAVFANTAIESAFIRETGVEAGRIHEIVEPLDMEGLRTAPFTDDPRLLALRDKKFVLFIGRKDEGKGVGLLAELFEEGIGDASLVLAGESTFYFESKVRPRLQSGRVLALEGVGESAKMWLLKNCSAYCMVSNLDSFGITYLEAWHAGKPVLAADVPAMRCVIRDGKDGLLVPYGNGQRLREALSQLLSDDDRARHLGEAGRQRVLQDWGDFNAEKKMEQALLRLAGRPS